MPAAERSPEHNNNFFDKKLHHFCIYWVFKLYCSILGPEIDSSISPIYGLKNLENTAICKARNWSITAISVDWIKGRNHPSIFVWIAVLLKGVHSQMFKLVCLNLALLGVPMGSGKMFELTKYLLQLVCCIRAERERGLP